MEAENLDTNYAAQTCRKHGIPDDAVAKARAKGIDLWVHDTAPVIFKKPGRQEFKRFVEKSQKDGKRADSIEELVRACIVYPEQLAAVDSLFEAYPVLLTELCAEINTVGAGKPAEASKKL